MAILLQDGHAKAMEGIDIAGVVITGEVVDTLPHLCRGLVGEGHAKNICRVDAVFFYKIGISADQKLGLTASRTRKD